KPDEILAAGDSLKVPGFVPNAERTNRTTAASWGLVGKLRSTQDPAQNSLEIATQAGLRWSIDVVTGAATLLKELRQPNESLLPPAAPSFLAPVTPIRDLVGLGASFGASSGTGWDLVGRAGVLGARTDPWQNHKLFLVPYWLKGFVIQGDYTNLPPWLAIDGELIALPMGGDGLPLGQPVATAQSQLHFWSGEAATDPNLIQGLYFDASSAVATWSSSR